MRLGTTELLLILALALVIFGPTKLPEMGKAMGKAIKEFRTQANKITEDFEDDSDEEKRS